MTSDKFDKKEIVLITGAAGNVGTAITGRLAENFDVVGLDRDPAPDCKKCYNFDLADKDSVNQALKDFRKDYGSKIAAVIHLAAYFDFSGNYSPLYKKVNEDGTRNLLRALEGFEVGRFIYSSTMLVHKPGVPGERITEATPLKPQWAYPQSKARTERIIAGELTKTPYTILRLAGLIGDQSAVPTLAQQIARIYQKSLKSRVYSGDLSAGQAFVHKDDMVDAFVKVVENRHKLDRENILLIGEEKTESYQALQNRIASLIHGVEEWTTVRIPKFIAWPASKIEYEGEKIIPDAIDGGKKPFIKPFMVHMASDHYELDLTRAREQLGWSPGRSVYETLPDIIKALKKHPSRWYKAHGINRPGWMKKQEQ